MEQSKFCSICNKDLPLSCFSTRRDFIKTLNDYRVHYCGTCKECTAKRKARWRESHPDYNKTYHEGMKGDAITKKCANCGAEFSTKNPNQKLCRLDCKRLTIAEEWKQFKANYPGLTRDLFNRMRNARLQKEYIEKIKQKQ